jgi:hypothetical protein
MVGDMSEYAMKTSCQMRTGVMDGFVELEEVEFSRK